MKIYFLKFTLFFVFAISSFSLCWAQSTDARWTWHHRPVVNSKPTQAVVMIVHGLNTNPEKMQSLRDFFLDQQDETLSVVLSGHGGSLQAFKKVTREQWLQDLYTGYRRARARADELHVPLYFLGYSLGAALGMDLATDDHFKNVVFDKYILIAPALSLRWRVQTLKAFNVFGPGFVIPSVNNKEYRAHRGTTVAAYNALFSSIRHLQSQDVAAKITSPVLLIVDPKDEAVSAKGLAKFIQKKHLLKWQLKFAHNDGSLLRRPFHHLIIDVPSMGFRNWRDMTDGMRDFLSRSSVKLSLE